MWLYDRPIAHRGLHDDKATENSMAAFRNAVEKGYIIETDVHLLKTGQVVIFHDNTLKRLCGKNVAISSLTLDDIKSDKYLLPNGEHIPLFSELLELCESTNTPILLELKLAGFNYDLERACLKLIKGKENLIAVQAFNPYTVKWFRKHAPEFQRGILSAGIILPLSKLLFKSMKPNFLAFDVNGMTEKLKNYATKHGAKTIVWTVRTPEALKKAISVKVNNIIFEKVDLEKEGFSQDKLDKVD